MSLIDLDSERLPRHVAIIMDGNGRWAANRGLPRAAGHRRGKEAVRAVVEAADRLKIPFLTLYAFSTENWNRPPEEVRVLMNLLERYLRGELRRLMEHQIRLVPIGSLERLPERVRGVLERVVEATKHNRGMTVVLAVSYGSREEIARAARSIAGAVRRGEIDPEDVTETTVAAHLATAGIPDPDVLIRTSGESRLSNFLLWQLAYTEILTTTTLWPDFTEAEFLDLMARYQRRERRFGRTSEQLERERAGAAR